MFVSTETAYRSVKVMEIMIFVDSEQRFKKPTQNKEHRNKNSQKETKKVQINCTFHKYGTQQMFWPFWLDPVMKIIQHHHFGKNCILHATLLLHDFLQHKNCNIPYPEITLFGPLVHFCIVIIIQACKTNKSKSDQTNYFLYSLLQFMVNINLWTKRKLSN